VAAWGSVAVNRRKKRREMGRAKRIGEIFFLREAGKAKWGAMSEWMRADEHPCRSISA
jgi:hypothetical protein